MHIAKEAYAKYKYMEAEQHALAAIEAAKMFPPEDTRAGLSIDFLAHVYKATGRFKDAESRFEEALEYYASRVGPAHPWTLERFPITRGHSRQQQNSFRIPLV